MDNKSINCLNMLQTTQACLESNESIYKDVPAVVTASGELDAIVGEILTTQRIQASAEGLSAAKGTVRLKLAETAFELVSLVHACAQENGMEEVAQRSDLSLTAVQSGTEVEFIDRIKGILADVAELPDDPADWGVTPAKIKAVKDLAAKFEKVKPLTRSASAKGRSATLRLKVLFTRASKLLRTRLDRLVVQFKKSAPNFYEEYKSARTVVAQAATHEAAAAKVARTSGSSQAKAA